MSKRKVPETSLAAFKDLKPDQLRDAYQKIIEALQVLRSANYEKIASVSRLDKYTVGRRVSEMEKMNLIWRPGGKSLTTSGKNSFLWQLSTETEAILPPVEKSDKKAKSVATYSKKIKELSTPFIQPSLF